jgi:hypothetical protein
MLLLQQRNQQPISPLQMFSEALKTDLSDFIKTPETKPYEFNLNLKITDMNQFLNDVKTLVRNNWKVVLCIALVVFFISNYNEIKSGFVDGWNSK